MEIVIKGDLLDYIDEEELREDVRSQVKFQLKQIISNDGYASKMIMPLIIKEASEIELTNIMKQMLKEKIKKVIKEDYIDEEDSFKLRYDAKIPEKIQKVFEENEEAYSMIIQQKLDEVVENYKPDNYLISELAKTLLLQDEECVNILKETLKDRIYDIIEKI